MDASNKTSLSDQTVFERLFFDALYQNDKNAVILLIQDFWPHAKKDENLRRWVIYAEAMVDRLWNLNYHDAKDRFESLLEEQGELPKKLLKRVLGGAGVVYNNLQQPDKALNVFQRAIQVNRTLDDLLAVAGNLITVALIYYGIEQFETAIETAEEGLSILGDID